MRSRRWWLSGAAAVALVALGLSGCSGEPAGPIASEEPTETPREPAFPSPEAAFEAAVKVYERYYAISNEITSQGGAEPGRLLEVVEDNEFAQSEFEVFAWFESNKVHSEGTTTFKNARLVQYQDVVDMIQIYACADVSGARILTADGADVTPDRDELSPYLVTFSIGESRSIMISDSVIWDYPGIC